MSNENYSNYVSKSDLNSIENKFFTKISSLESDISNNGRTIDKLNMEVIEMSDNFRSLMNDIARHYNDLQNTLNRLVNENQRGNSLLKDNQNALIQGFSETKTSITKSSEVAEKGLLMVSETSEKGLQKVSETSEKGLTKVSTGMAIIDALQARSESSESKIAIDRAFDEINTRYDQAQDAVAEKKNLFYNYYKETIDGFRSDLKNIASHIFETVDKNFSNLDDISIDSDEELSASCLNIKKQETRIQLRNEMLDRQFSKLNISNLSHYMELREKLDHYVNNGDALTFTHEDVSNFPPVYIPVIAVNRNDESNNYFTLNMKAESCNKDNFIDPEYKEVFSDIQTVFKNILLERRDLPEEMVSDIKEGLKNLMTAGLLKKNHYDLVLQHLDKYKLKSLTYSI